MATATRKIFVNWLTKQLQVSDQNGGQVVLPPFYKYETVPWEVVIVEPDTSSVGVQKWRRVDISNLSLAMAINNTLDDATPLCYQSSFNKDEDLNIFSGSLAINTAAMNSHIGSSSEVDVYFEIETQEGAESANKVYQVGIKVKNSVAPIGAVVPTPVDEYFTKNQTTSQFMPNVGPAGRQQTYTSPGNVYQRIIGVTDEGQPVDQIVPVVP